MFKKAKENKKGFTLAELLIAVAIIAVLVAISIPIFTSQLEKARRATTAANLRSAYAEASAAVLSYDNGASVTTDSSTTNSTAITGAATVTSYSSNTYTVTVSNVNLQSNSIEGNDVPFTIKQGVTLSKGEKTVTFTITNAGVATLTNVA